MPDRCAFTPCVKISLKCHRIVLGDVPVGPETAMQEMPAVFRVLTIQIGKMIVIEVLCKESITPSSLKLSSVLCGAKCLLLRATSACHQSAQSVIGLFCRDIDNAIHRVSAPYRGSRPADHFNPVNIL